MVGFKPTHIRQLEHVVGVHVGPFEGMFASVLVLDGTELCQVHLDKYTIAATLLGNQNLAQQAQVKPQQRTAKERQHRLADALVTICRSIEHS